MEKEKMQRRLLHIIQQLAVLPLSKGVSYAVTIVTVPNDIILFTSDGGHELTPASRSWRKAVMLVWGQIAQHKYANLFLQAVKDDEATGYSEVIHK